MDQFQDASLSNTHTRKKLLYILACHHGGTHYAYHLCLNWCMLFTRKCFAFDVLLFIWIIFQTLLFIFMLPLTCSSRMHTSKSWTTSPLNVSACFLFFFFLRSSHLISSLKCYVSYFPVPYVLACDNMSYCQTAGIYSPNAYRGFAREFIKDLERIRCDLFIS